MIVPDQISRGARLYSDRIAAICGDEQRSFQQIDDRTSRLANALLARGMAAGDRVATWLGNSIRCVETDFALAKAGLVRVSLNSRLTPSEVEFILRDSGARALIYDAGYDAALAGFDTEIPGLEIRIGCGPINRYGIEKYEAVLAGAPATAPAISFDPEHLYCLFYTSGTTGRPKGVMLSHRAVLQVAYNLKLETGPFHAGEKILLMQAMSHGAGFFVLPYWFAGGTCVIMPDFDAAEVLRLAEKHAIETIKLVPTMLQRILRLPGIEAVKLPRLQQIIYGASPMPTEALHQAIAVFGDGRLVQIYGQSEAPVTISVLHGDQHRQDNPYPERLASAGRPWATVEIRIADDAGQDVPAGEAGEVLVRAPQVMSGYWKREELSAETLRDGWLHTKDIGRLDDAGYVYLLGRKDEMIISGGYNIAPFEVEEELHRHPAVLDAAVVGEKDPEWGQSVVAYIVRRHDSVTAQEIIDASKAALGFKRPKRIYFVAELPKNNTGKIQKTALHPGLALEGRG
jgi:acyl-CoA synthetase (AMP-forming)/AMP-acid ligase II